MGIQTLWGCFGWRKNWGKGASPLACCPSSALRPEPFFINALVLLLLCAFSFGQPYAIRDVGGMGGPDTATISLDLTGLDNTEPGSDLIKAGFCGVKPPTIVI